MNYHGGLLEPKGRIALWIGRVPYQRLPAEVDRDLAITLNTPGFSTHYWCHAFQISEPTLYHMLDHYLDEKWHEEAIANWASVTREDAMALAKLRPPDGHLPSVCCVHIAQDRDNGVKYHQIAADYNCATQTVWLKARKEGPLTRNRHLEDWFKARIPGI